jgi:hypothetical protein
MTAAYAHKFARVTISGTCFGGAEEWSTGFQMGSPTTDIVGVGSPGAQNIATAWQTFFTAPTSYISDSYKTTQVKVAMIETDGRTNLDEIDYYLYPTPISGGGGSATNPPQITLAATLTSDNQRGLASKGRMYLPGISLGVNNATGKITTSFVTSVVANFKTFLDSVNTAAGTSGKVILASKGRRTQNLGTDGQPIYIDGRSAWVTGCRIGDVLDTQRRRRNGLVETYQTRVLAP